MSGAGSLAGLGGGSRGALADESRGVFVGMDAGGTKLAVRVEAADGTRLADVQFAAEDWSAEPAEAAADWLLARLERALPEGADVIAVGIGAQGCDTPDLCEEIEHAFADKGVDAVVVNDGALLVPASGLTDGIGVIAGTGSIAVGLDDAGHPLFAGGWGWVLGDDGGSAALVREATKAALTAVDDGAPDDGLLGALLAAFGVPNAPALARAVNDDPRLEHWAPHGPVVYAAADAGSQLARSVIEAAGHDLVRIIGQLVNRGAVGTDVVAAGSVIVNQPRLADAVRARLAERHPGYGLRLLEDDPVAGGVLLARRRHESRDPVPAGRATQEHTSPAHLSPEHIENEGV
ncbi:N-acetylglucosamine kinase [Plantibacter sp. YIM 135249]|uniref:N-acetylglucosamine kinase n=1 Tax=Plantibacter sp. YIM 135249 TaxID=3423918 RepID=UPI003D33E51B